MAQDMKCPACGNVFDADGVMAAELDKKYQQEYQAKLQQSMHQVDLQKKELLEAERLFEEKRKKENEIFMQKLAQERKKMEDELQQQLRKSIASDFENKLKILEDENRNSEEKLKLSRQKELEYLQ